MKREAICPVCGKHFTARRKNHRYCSAACRKYDYRKHPRKAEDVPENAAVLRRFTCERCGAVVSVTDICDRRRRFCSSHCERLYWKHRRRQSAQADPPAPVQKKQKTILDLYRGEIFHGA